MKQKTIEQARNPDLRASMAAMRRAAARARDVAVSTHTSLIVMKDGRWMRIAPSTSSARKV